MELCCRQFFFWTSEAVFSHSAQHGICFSRWRSISIACASAAADRFVGVGFWVWFGCELQPSSKHVGSGRSFEIFILRPYMLGETVWFSYAGKSKSWVK